MRLSFEYGQGLMSAELPDTTDVFIPGERSEEHTSELQSPCKGRYSADFPQKGIDQADFAGTLPCGSGEKGYSSDLFKWSSSEKHRAGASPDPRSGTVSGILVQPSDHHACQ